MASSGMQKAIAWILVGVVLGVLARTMWPTDALIGHGDGVIGRDGDGVLAGPGEPAQKSSSRDSGESRDPSEESVRRAARLDQIDFQVERLRENAERRTGELAIRLALGDAQVARMAELVDERLAGYRAKLWAEDLTVGLGWQIDMLDLADRLIGDILSPGQQAVYREQRERERAARIEATALVELSRLSVLDLNEKQKGEAFEVLVREATEHFTESPQIPGYRSIGVDEIPETRKAVEEKIDLVRPILDPVQLRVYRQRLEWEMGLHNVRGNP